MDQYNLMSIFFTHSPFSHFQFQFPDSAPVIEALPYPLTHLMAIIFRQNLKSEKLPTKFNTHPANQPNVEVGWLV